MNKIELTFLGVTVALALAIGIGLLIADTHRIPAPDASVGKCIQAQRVLYQVGRGEAAETCLAELDENGPARFARTWANYETEVGSW